MPLFRLTSSLLLVEFPVELVRYVEMYPIPHNLVIKLHRTLAVIY